VTRGLTNNKNLHFITLWNKEMDKRREKTVLQRMNNDIEKAD